ncbi:MAG: hypothetical protein ACTSU2_00335 [Promethearchaeota archaeon]
MDSKNMTKGEENTTLRFCDFSCLYLKAQNSENMAGDCKTELALFCSKYNKYVKKNDLCIEYKRKLREQNKLKNSNTSTDFDEELEKLRIL